MVEPTIKAKLILDTSGGLAGSASKTSGGLTGSVSTGLIAKGVGTALVTLGAIKKFLGKLVDSSPRLQASLSILNRTFTLLLRPIGDIIALFLKPFAIGMLKHVIPYYKGLMEKLKKPEAQIGGAVGLAGGAVAGGAAGGKIGSVFGPAGAAIGAGVGAVAGAIAGGLLGIDIGAKLGEWGRAIYKWFSDMDGAGLLTKLWDVFSVFYTETLPSLVSKGWDVITKFFTEDLPYAAGYAFESVLLFFTDTLPNTAQTVWDSIITFFSDTLPTTLGELWDSMILFFSETLPTKLEELANKVLTFITVDLPKWFSDTFDKFMKIITVDIPKWFSDMAGSVSSYISGIIDKVKGFFNLGREDAKKTTKVKDAIITKDGKVIQTDPKDNIIATKGGIGGNVNVSVSINALDASSINASLIDNLVRQITQKLKRELQGKSSYGIGI